jgi:hypothetical protein
MNTSDNKYSGNKSGQAGFFAAFYSVCRNNYRQWKTWLGNRLRRVPFFQYLLDDVRRKHRIYVNHEGKVVFHNMSYYLTKGCNLKCEYCSTCSPFRDGYHSKEVILEEFEQWGQRIEPTFISFVGGEPFIHPDYEELILAARRIWNHSHISVLTNGLLLCKVNDDFLKQLAKEKIQIGISHHIQTPEYDMLLNKNIKRFIRIGVPYQVGLSDQHWLSRFTFDNNRIPIPCHSNPKIAWKNCCSKNCTTIVDRTIHRCGPLTCIQGACLEEKLPSDWNIVLEHKGMSIESSAQDICEYLRGDYMAVCTVCPEHPEVVNAQQIQHHHLLEMRRIIKEMNQNIVKDNIQFVNKEVA